MVYRFCLALFLVQWISACGVPPPPPTQKPVDYESAKALSDRIANDMLNDDVGDIYKHLDVGFQLVVKNSDDVKKALEKMYAESGHPLLFDFKISKIGRRTDGSWVRPLRTFWYAVKTKKYEKGKYFLKVEIVPAIGGGPLDISGFGILDFKTTVPSDLQ